MPQKQYVPHKSIAYFFNRSKDTHEENGIAIITLFARLTREFTYDDGFNTYEKAETVWVDMEDIKMEKATEKMKALPNCMQRYTITEKVFRELYQLSKNCPRELYYITPFHHESIREKFVP
jgi:hypothetical protein